MVVDPTEHIGESLIGTAKIYMLDTALEREITVIHSSAMASGKPRPRVRRSARAREPDARSGDEEAALTFSEAELRTVLAEEFEWQRAMVADLVRRLKKRKNDD